MKLKIITSNAGKAQEFKAAFAGLGIDVEHVKMPYDEIQSSELENVVEKGMEELISKGMKDFVIDDSGLFVNALKGFPGVYSSYVQKTIGNKGILDLMSETEERSAEFRCCIGCNLHGENIIVTGICKGTILKKEEGTGGFGFDPIFSHNGKDSFAEIGMEEKNAVSHRGLAIKALLERIRPT